LTVDGNKGAGLDHRLDCPLFPLLTRAKPETVCRGIRGPYGRCRWLGRSSWLRACRVAFSGNQLWIRWRGRPSQDWKKS